jgi:hypothetical protein
MEKHFIEPDLLKADTIIDYDGIPTPGMEPLNDEAVKRLDEYYKRNPQATLNPVDNLPRTMAAVVEVEPPKAAVIVAGKGTN